MVKFSWVIKEMKKKIMGFSSLLLCTLIWGFAFIAQSMGMDAMGPFTFQAIRCLLATVFLFLTATVMDGYKIGFKNSLALWKDPQLLRYGILCGSVLFIAASLQQIGIIYTDAGKAGFLTAMYIVLVPLIGIFTRKKPPVTAIVSVIPAVIGVYLLSCTGVGSMNIGDVFLLCGALGFAVQILLIDRHAGTLSGLRFNCIQCMIMSLLSMPFMLLEDIDPQAILGSWGALAFAGILSMGLAYSLQIIGQKQVEPTAASLILSLESVFAVLGGWLVLGETMNARELLGCGLMFSAVVLSQLPVGKLSFRKQKPVAEQ